MEFRVVPPVPVFLTGVTGFIGSELARHLIQHGIDGRRARLICLVRQPWTIPIDIREHIEILPGGLGDLARYKHRLATVEYVFHLAANARALAARAAGDDYRESNVEGTRALVEALQGSRLKRLVHASTIGAVDRRPEDSCAAPITEESLPNPLTAYGKSKLAAEKIVRESGLPHAILRITWAFGPGMRPESHVRVFLRSVRRGGFATRFGFPGRVSLISIRDLVRAFSIVAVHPEAANGVFFAAGMRDTGDAVALGKLFEAIGRIGGKRAGTFKLPAAVGAVMRKARRHLPFAAQNLFSDLLTADASRLRALGFKPEVTLDEEILELAHREARDTPGFQDDGVCLVTGAASGIGRAIARQLYARGRRLILVDREQTRLAEVARELRGAEALAIDLVDRAALNALCARVRGGDDAVEQQGSQQQGAEQQRDEISWVVNCAGVGALGDVKDIDAHKLQALIDVNVTALTALSQAALCCFARRGHGRLVNIASSVSFFPLPHMAAYAASKAFVLHFTEALREENKNLSGVHILAVCPSGTDTRFQENSGVRKLPNERMLTAWDVSARIIERAERKGGTLLIGSRTWISNWSARFMSRRSVTRTYGRLMERMRCPDPSESEATR